MDRSKPEQDDAGRKTIQPRDDIRGAPLKLKRVKIFGFKTFADKTEFDLNGDIIAVVGPNGCGKSNIVDSIMWALGEPNARNLRAANSQEIIFSGSSSRKPLGYAEVTLLFDNEDGGLQIDSPEVSITRKVSRNGESDYFINRQTCRLKDVYDLLADSGLGRAGYAIVGQKEIDAALAASAEDRRGWIDEAAGVQRYRAKRQESIKRLASATAHLERIGDIVREIESQREPLKEEAELAKLYKSALASLREVESGLMMVEVANAIKELEALAEKIKSCLTLADQERHKAENLEAQMKDTGVQISDLEREIDAVRELQQSALTATERAEAALQLGHQKLASLDEFEATLREEKEAGNTRAKESESDLERLTHEEAQEKEALDRLTAEMAGTDDHAKELTKALAEIEQAIELARKEHANRLKIEAEAKHRAGRIAEIKEELSGIKQSMPDMQAGVDEASAALAGIATQLDEHTKQAEVKGLELETIEQQEEQLGQSVRKLLAEIASMEGRRRGIEATIETYEGLAQGSRAVLQAVEIGKLSGQYVPVAEAIHADQQHALAIEIALGASLNDLIVPDESHAKRAIEYLKQNRLGRATFQPISLMRRHHLSRELQSLLAETGVVGLAAELVECEPAYRPVIDSLLGRVLVTQNLGASLRLAKSTGWSRLVTLDGEVVHSSGAVTGGNAARQSSGILQRKAELELLERDLEGRQKTLSHHQKEQKELESKRDRIRLELEAIKANLKTIQPEHNDAERWLNDLRHEMNAAIRTAEKLSSEFDALNAAQTKPDAQSTTDIAELEKDRDALLKSLARRTADAEQATERLQEARIRYHQIAERLKEATRRFEAAGSAEATRERRLLSLSEDRKRAHELIEKHEKERGIAQNLYAQNSEQLELLQLKRRELLEESFQLAEQAKDAQKSSGVAADLAHRSELERARVDARRASAQQRLLEEYGITEEEATWQAEGVELPEDAAIIVNRLRREIKAMGDVNLGAIDAYERLTERYQELHFQSEDILQSKAEIESGIKELDGLTRERFLDTFAKLQTSFQETFNKLFGGGEGRLYLTNENDLLQTGVEVEVTIPGKKRQRLDLLSGGERALSACAFLFGLLKVKPSPLVVLDEVDAPLDGRNVERFISLLKDFAGQTQFILITHNPVTIASAPLWFGVTMQEPGVSTVVPFRSELASEQEPGPKSQAKASGDIASSIVIA